MIAGVGSCVSPMGGAKGDEGCWSFVMPPLLALRRARSREGQATQEPCGGAEDRFASASDFSTVGFFTSSPVQLVYAHTWNGERRRKWSVLNVMV